MNYTLDAGCWNSVMAVPTCVVDEYIKLCSGDALKLLLFLLRNGGRVYSAATLCEKLGIKSEGEVEDAARFWIQRGLIAESPELSNENRQTLVPSDAPAIPPETEAAPAPVQSAGSSLKKVGSDFGLYFTSGEIAERMKNDEKIDYLFKAAERLYGHPLKTKDMQAVIALTDTLGMPAEVAVMLLSYCVKIDKATPAYIVKAARDWIDNGITTLELADAKIMELERRNTVEERLRKEMELNTKFTAKQQEYIRVWTAERGFDIEMIMLAYEETLNHTGKMSFPYCDKILENWFTNGIKTPAALTSSEKKKTESAKTDSSFDVEGVMAQIMKKYSDTKT